MTSHPKPVVTASRLKVLIARLITSQVAGRIIGVAVRNRVRHHGLVFDVSSVDFTPRVRAEMFWGAYEGAEVRMIRAHLRDAATVVELGSSLGVTTGHVASVLSECGRLVCVEANPALLDGLRERLGRQAPDIRVDYLTAAVTERAGLVPFAVSPQTTGSRLGASRPGETAAMVPTTTLRETLERFSITDYDLVSDIEGAEASFLITDPGVLDGCRRAVIEMHDCVVDGTAVSVEALIGAARSAGFRVLEQRGAVVALTRD